MTQREREEKLCTELGLGFATQQHNPKKQLDILWRHCLSLMERLEEAEGIVRETDEFLLECENPVPDLLYRRTLREQLKRSVVEYREGKR